MPGSVPLMSGKPVSVQSVVVVPQQSPVVVVAAVVAGMIVVAGCLPLPQCNLKKQTVCARNQVFPN